LCSLAYPILSAVILLGGAAPAWAVEAPGQDADAPIIRSIEIQGNDRTDPLVIRREMGLTEGDRFYEDNLDVIWDHLEDVGYFAFVNIEYEEVAPGQIDLTVTVEEDKTFHVGPLIEYDRRHKYLLGIQLTEHNFRGQGERVALRASWYRLHRYRLLWERPWFLGRRGLAASLGGGWERGGFVYRPTDYSFWDVGGKIGWNVWRRLTFTGGLSYAEFHHEDRFLDLTRQYHADEPGDIVPGGMLSWQYPEWHHKVILSAELSWDSRDILYYPTRGAFHTLGLRRVRGRGFDSYTEGIADLRQFFPLPWKHILALRAWGRLVDSPLPFEDRLYWGGPESIRGYDYASLEGEEGYLLTAEYRWPMFLMPISPNGRVIGIGVHLFTDTGDAWYEGDDPGDVRWSWGGGVHLNVSTLQFRFEVARTEEGDTVFQFEDTFNF
jgi:outer membrane protein assembly factor BamA